MTTESEDVFLPSSDEETASDDDTFTEEYLEQYFQHKYKIHDQTVVASKHIYVLSIAKDHSLTCLAAGLSDGSVRLFDISSERGLYITAPRTTDIKNSPCICGVRFFDETPNLLLVGTTNGLVRLIDLRTENEVTRFKYDSKYSQNILCFDYNSNSSVLCMGTERRADCVYMLFYDVRERKQINCYSESHYDDVTSLKFHPQKPNLLCSGSTDGLINIFDLKETNEDDALLHVINTESSVHKMNWHKDKYNKDAISCITHMHDFKLYDDECDLVTEFKRAQITDTIKSSKQSDLIDCHNIGNGDIFLLAGTNGRDGSILRSLRFKNNQLLPFANFEGNKQIIRDSILDVNSNVLITAGEKGIVTLWTPQTRDLTTSNNSDSSELKMKTKKSNKVKPY